MATVRQRVDTATALLSLPFALLHEFSHFAVAHAVTREAKFAVSIFETGAATDENGNEIGGVAAWPPIDSRPLRVFAHLSPTVFGTILMGLWGWSGTPIDGWRFILAVGLFWYTVPSPGDVRGAFGIQEAQQEVDN